MKKKKVLFLTQFSILLAIEAIFCFTPLGSIPFTPVIVATTAMIPVIITAVLLGTAAGTAMGFCAGVFSFIIWSLTPPNPLIAFLFTPVAPLGNFFSIIVNFVPRIMVGLFSGLFFSSMKRVMEKNKPLEIALYALTGAIGSLANTVLVLAGWYFFFAKEIAQVFGENVSKVFDLAIKVTFITNGLPEMGVSVVVGIFVCLPLRKILLKQNML